MTLGTDQSERFPAALASDSVLVDETSPQELVQITRRLAGLLRFVGQDGRMSGDWGRLLDRDESALLAAGLSFDLQAREQGFLDDFAAARPARLAAQLIELAHWLDDWVEDLGWIDRPWARALRARVEQGVMAAVSREHVGDLADGVRGVTQEIVRRAGLVLAEGPLGEAGSGETPPSRGELRRIYFALLQSIGRVQLAAQADWPASLESGRHEPAAALVLALLQVFGRIQRHVNQFTERLTAFYYDDVLGFTLKPATPDRLHLLFERDPNYAAPVRVPAGTPFRIGRAGAADVVEFAADDDLVVTDAAVATLRTLRLQRDRLISPEYELGYVTRARADSFGPSVGSEPGAQARYAALLGPDIRSAKRQETTARIGLAVSSPVLWLQDGERAVSLGLSLRFVDGDTGALIDLLSTTTDDALFRQTLGRLFARWVLTDEGVLTTADLDTIRDVAARRMPFGDPAAASDNASSDLLLQFVGPVANSDWTERRHLVRNALMEKIFVVAVSTANGWFEVQRTILAAPSAAGGAAQTLTLAFHLSNEDPAVCAPSLAVHGAGWPTDAPTIRLTLNEAAPVFPLSLLEGVALEAVDIAVEVEGLRDVRASNQLGALDPSRPFMPFGPVPDLASYLMIAAPELARKHVTELVVRPEWVGLPPTGFDLYYAGYDSGLDDTAFAVMPAILRDGLWVPGAGRPQRLFASGAGASPRPLPIAFDPAALRAQWRPTTETLVIDQNARNGFVRLQLAAPAAAFGHQLYPTILTDSLSAKVRGRSRVAPNMPYTPMLARLTLDYAATARIELGRQADAEPGQRVLHLHPFGLEEIYPTARSQHRLLARTFGHDGNLFIALSGSAPDGMLTLFFDLRHEAAVEVEARRQPRPRIEWSYLSADGWQPLEERRVLSDTTAGFLRTGVVALDLPAGLVASNPAMPPGFYWLRMSSDDTSGRFAGLRAVATQAVRATRTPAGPPPVRPLPAQSIDLRSASVPGVLSIRQPDASFGLRRGETRIEQRTRIGERLRHKGRASNPWDYERLVLEAFGSVHRARCLPNLNALTGAAEPGHVLVVVTPSRHRNDPRYATRGLRLDPLELDRIEQYLAARASPAVRVSVRSPSYELIQVRCRVALRPGTHVGEALRRINAAIINELSPWRDGGCCASFDWQIRGEDIEDCVRRIPDVEGVTGVSMVHVWEGAPDERGATWLFEDTAAPESGAPASDAPGSGAPADQPIRVRAQHPWSLPLPVEEHFIDLGFELGDDASVRTGIAGGTTQAVAANARAAGRSIPSLAGLPIDSTFVVGRNSSERPVAETET